MRVHDVGLALAVIWTKELVTGNQLPGFVTGERVVGGALRAGGKMPDDAVAARVTSTLQELQQMGYPSHLDVWAAEPPSILSSSGVVVPRSEQAARAQCTPAPPPPPTHPTNMHSTLGIERKCGE